MVMLKVCKGILNYIGWEFGQYRVIYKYKENEIIILIMDIDNRGDIYKKY